VSATDHLGPQFNDLYEMKSGQTGYVPLHALHDEISAEYDVPARELEHAFVNDPPPHHTPESLGKLTEDVRKNGVRTPLYITREYGEHTIADGSHRYLASVRTGQTHVPVTLYDYDAPRIRRPGGKT
jgi:hypothetical protein